MRRLLSVLLVVMFGCSSGSSSVATSSRCIDDSNCAAGQTCEVESGNCVDGIGRDNHLTGKLTCRVGALTPADGVALGEIFVTGAIAGKRIELSIATGCEIQGSLIAVALNGKHNAGNASAGLTVPKSIAARTGEFVVDPYAFFLTEEHAFLYVTQIAGDHVAPTDPTIAYSLSGTGNVTGAATKDGDLLSLTIDVELALPAETRACVSTCVSQADCGTGAGRSSIDYPECTELWEGGPRSCQMLCEKGTDGKSCSANGGHCTVAYCHRATCDGVTTTDDCSKLGAEDCSTCCDLKNANAGDDNFDRMIQACGCEASAPCNADCAKACTTSDVAAFSKCSDCLTSDSAKACRTEVLTKCKGIPACDAYFTCLNACPA
jgi:hypothetical protein